MAPNHGAQRAVEGQICFTCSLSQPAFITPRSPQGGYGSRYT